MYKYLLTLLCLVLVGCTTSGPQKALDEMADAMEKHNGALFLSHIDMAQFAANHIRNLTSEDTALSSLDAIGKMFGLGNLDGIINNVMDMQSRISSELNRGVSSGELMAECRRTDKPNCPWVPQSMRNARIVELGPDSAIAQVITPTSMASWLSLKKIGNNWFVVGQSVLESVARAYAAEKAVPGGGIPPAAGKGI